ncbi:A-kinase anchor protein 13-like isoform X1 [Cuculus canorus]|uniref:A-kinase anchor protein 13-like isoform X1 n=2 Tax=Cuculus canorus TaxID=55661 RepID=UPI0023AA2926|nr:A-kinase anchor protein 13-like isoform X1 [Cuculus canorus]
MVSLSPSRETLRFCSMALRFRDVLFYAVPGAVGLLGCWWIYSRMKKKAQSPKEGQEEKVPEKDPHSVPISAKEECRENETSASVLPAGATMSDTSPEKWEAWEKELMEKEARLAQREQQLQRWWQDLERERKELELEKASLQLKGQSQIPNPLKKLTRVLTQSGATESSKEKSPARPQQGHVDSEPSVSPKRNTLLMTLKEKSPFRSPDTTKPKDQAAEEEPRCENAPSVQPKPKRRSRRGKRKEDC